MTSLFLQKGLPPQVLCILRFLLGLVFLYASVGKIFNPKGFAENLMAYQIFDSPQLLKHIAVTLPWVEWFCGIFLVLGVFVRSVSALTTLLLFLFLVGMVSALWRGLEIHCGCFGSAQETVGAFSLLRDGVFFLMSLAVLLSPVDPFSLQSFLRNRKSRPAPFSG
ncbi:MAG: DoxX family protein [Acidobacteria bacterium]|nr:DoxX family protein [Acidobacteriota bacterium]MCI0625963.1 DoxX family protein [Acidobacteriota bacterium]MCI0721425.1 DoxX family protein [Acidobacteriota bacterium]